MMIYGEDGQPQTGTYADYLLPTADVVPRIAVHHMESPTKLNPLGIKGAGESGTIAASAAVTAAVEDALREFGVEISELPITPSRLFALLKAAR
jgi:carbon-monoxide dehydrogenase large subunit